MSDTRYIKIDRYEEQTKEFIMYKIAPLNKERPACVLNYKTPAQYTTDLGFKLFF